MLASSPWFKSQLTSTRRIFDIKVIITKNTGGTVVDLSDRIISYQLSHDFESRNGRLNLEIDNYDYQLSPLNRTSSYNLNAGVYNPLFDSNHKVELYEGLLVNGEFEYIKKFEGYMGDDIQASESPIVSISCRDRSKLLQDIYIYQGPSYSLMLVEEVIQDMLKEFAGGLLVILEVKDPTLFMIGRPDSPYTAQDTNLWDAIQLLADSASQELRFMEDGTLVMRKIDRDFVGKTPHLTLDMSSLVTDSMEISDADVRNHIVVKVQDYDPITRKNNDSIAKYGRRYMEVHRSMSDIITDVEQAHELADNILRDLSYAHPSSFSEIALHPLVQVGDIVQMTNPRLGTNPETDIFKVTAVSNSYSKDRKRTSLTLQGHDLFMSEASVAPKPPTGLTYEIQRRIILNYPNSGWTGYEKETSFAMIKWIAPTEYIDNTPLEGNFGGYVIERATQLNKFTGALQTDWVWSTVASVPSYLNSLNRKVNWWYDYSAMTVLDKYKKAGKTGPSVALKYRITAINSRGKKSTKSTTLDIVVSFDKYKNMLGQYI
jgi:hypothetical protein